MIGTTLRKYRVGLIAISALLLATAASDAVTGQKQAAADARLQQLTDNAALAGVKALASSEGQTDDIRYQIASTAVHKVIASRSEIVPVITPSIDEMKMSVALNTGNGAAFTATARYVQPGSAVSPSRTAEADRKRPRG